MAINEDTMAELLGLGDAVQENNEGQGEDTGNSGEGDAGTGDAGGESGDGDSGEESGDTGTGEGTGDAGEGEGSSGDDQGSGEGEGSGEEGSGEEDSGKRILLGDESGEEQQESTLDFDATLSERSGGKFKTYADVEAAIADAGEATFANDMVRKLNEYVAGGGTATDFLKTQTVNFKEMSDLQAIKEQSVLFGEGLTPDEVDLLIEEEYGVGENATEREKKLAKIKIKKSGAEARKQLLEYQEQWAVPDTPTAGDPKASEAAVEKWKTELSDAVDANAEISFPAGKDKFVFKPSEEARNTIKGQHDLTKFWDRYKTENGYDVNKFVKDQYILNNYEQIIKSMATYFKGQGTEEIVDGMKNADFTGGDNKETGGGNKAPIIDQIGNELFS